MTYIVSGGALTLLTHSLTQWFNKFLGSPCSSIMSDGGCQVSRRANMHKKSEILDSSVSTSLWSIAAALLSDG